jgi:hypothetical protein
MADETHTPANLGKKRLIHQCLVSPSLLMSICHKSKDCSFLQQRIIELLRKVTIDKPR